MRKRKKNKLKTPLYFIVIILIFILFYYSVNDKEKNIIILDNLKDITASITKIKINKNNDRLNNDLINSINNSYKNEINELKKELKLVKTNSDKTFINARIIKRSTPYWYNLLTIDKGKKDNIKVGDAVINYKGLVGKVIKVNDNSSDVKLLISKSDDHISCSFKYEDKVYYGLITSYSNIKNELIIENVIGDFDKEKIKNINVTTSGLSDSFSSGLLIGKIKNITQDTFKISNIIKVTPEVDFNNINIVSVVKKG